MSIGARDFWSVLYLTGEEYRPWGAPDQAPPESRLGSRYQATYMVKLPHHRTMSMTQDLYPYAPGMVWSNTPSGQAFHDTSKVYTAPGGWWHSSALLEILTAHGLPAVAPVGSASSTSAGAPEPVVRAGGPGGPGAGGDRDRRPDGSPAAGGPGRAAPEGGLGDPAMRALGRMLLAGPALAAFLVTTAPGAVAKGEGQIVGGQAVVTGPGLAAPIVMRGKPLEHLLTWIGPTVPELLEARCCSRFTSPRPPASRLGPRYEVRHQVRYRLRAPGSPIGTHVVTIRQDLYPFAPNDVLHAPVPWAYTPGGQTVSVGARTFRVDSGWTDSALVFDLLEARGLPKKPPAAVPAVADPPGGSGPGPVTVMGLAGLGLVLVLGAMVARRASRRP